jgi:oligoendopeptidase F
MERSSIPDKYKWDTTDLYPNDEAWAKAKNEASSRIPAVAAFQGRLGESAGVFHEALSSWASTRPSPGSESTPACAATRIPA